MLGLLEPKAGRVTICGVSPREAFQKWPGAVAYVPQAIHVYEGTIRENIIFGYKADSVTDKMIWQALEMSNLADFVEKLPRGIDTVIGKGGRELSGGQNQRLGIARALITSPRLIVLDEATNALDKQSREFIENMLSKMGSKVTVVIISHSRRAISKCDLILELSETEEYQLISQNSRRKSTY